MFSGIDTTEKLYLAGICVNAVFCVVRVDVVDEDNSQLLYTRTNNTIANRSAGMRLLLSCHSIFYSYFFWKKVWWFQGYFYLKIAGFCECESECVSERKRKMQKLSLAVTCHFSQRKMPLQSLNNTRNCEKAKKCKEKEKQQSCHSRGELLVAKQKQQGKQQ